MTDPGEGPAALPHEWSQEALYPKAQRYAEEMLGHPRDSWLFPFWSTLTLELLARAALAHTSPALLADARDWKQLQFALGQSPVSSKFTPKSIDVKSVFERLSGVHPTFDPTLVAFSVSHMVHRNAELHSGQTPFDGALERDWLPMFYRTCECLLDILGVDLEAFLGTEEAGIATEMITAAKDEGAKAIAKTIAAHKTVWEKKTDEEREELTTQAKAWATRRDGHRVTCPSCESVALVTGEPIKAPSVELAKDMIVETQYHLPSRFECIACGLKISGLAELNAAGLGETYKATRTFDVADYYGLHDPYMGFEEDFNER